jgi:hypothetical protein
MVEVAQQMGITDVIGIDGAYARGVGLQIDDSHFVAADLASAVPDLGRRFDLAMSLGVAEQASTALPMLTDAIHPQLAAFWERRATRPVSTPQGARLTLSAASNAVRRRRRR